MTCFNFGCVLVLVLVLVLAFVLIIVFNFICFLLSFTTLGFIRSPMFLYLIAEIAYCRDLSTNFRLIQLKENHIIERWGKQVPFL